MMQPGIRLFVDTLAGLLALKQLDYTNPNAVFQAALRPFRKKVTSQIIFEFVPILDTHIFRG